MLGSDYQVQRAPWDHTDRGGALDSKYGLQCLQLFLFTTMLETTSYDIIIFNFGIHDIDYSGKWPEEYTALTEYAKNLKAIKSILLSTGAEVGYVFTTPLPFNITLNTRVKQYNSVARDVMNEQPTIATADLYTWVVEACGEPPYKDCIIAAKQPSPHYTAQGYEYLSERIISLIVDLAEGLGTNTRSNEKSTQAQQENARFDTSTKSLVRILNHLVSRFQKRIDLNWLKFRIKLNSSVKMKYQSLWLYCNKRETDSLENQK